MCSYYPDLRCSSDVSEVAGTPPLSTMQMIQNVNHSTLKHSHPIFGMSIVDVFSFPAPSSQCLTSLTSNSTPACTHYGQSSLSMNSSHCLEQLLLLWRERWINSVCQDWLLYYYNLPGRGNWKHSVHSYTYKVWMSKVEVNEEVSSTYPKSQYNTESKKRKAVYMLICDHC